MCKLLTKQEKQIHINGYDMIAKMGGKWAIDGVARSLIYDREYEPQTTAVFKELIKSGMKVVDIGANIGYYTLLAAKLVGEHGTVWGFEPEPRNYGNLLENIQINNFENIIAIKKAVSDIQGKSPMYVSEKGDGEHSLVPNRIEVKFGIIEVETVKLDNVITEEINFIKTDTEGNELAVLRGARRILSGGNIKLVVEFFPLGFSLVGYTVEDLWALLLECGFRHMYLLDEWKHKALPTNIELIQQHIKRYKYSVNVLCSKTAIG